MKVKVACSPVRYHYKERQRKCFLHFSIIQFQLVATPYTIKYLGEKGEVQFSRCTPIFFTSILSLWFIRIHFEIIRQDNIEWSWVVNLIPVWMKHGKTTTSPNPAPCWSASCITNTQVKSHHTQNNNKKHISCPLTIGQYNDSWRIRLGNVRKRQIREVHTVKTPPFKSLHFTIQSLKRSLSVRKDPITPHTTRPSETRRKKPEIASQMSILLTLVHNWIQ